MGMAQTLLRAASLHHPRTANNVRQNRKSAGDSLMLPSLSVRTSHFSRPQWTVQIPTRPRPRYSN